MTNEIIKTDNNSGLSLKELLKKERPNREFLFEGIIKGGVGFVYGVPKSGKTTWCESLGLHLASGADYFMGKKLTGKKYKVLFLSMEESWDNRAYRNENQITEFNDSVLENFHVSDGNFPLMIVNEKDWEEVETYIINFMPDIVFIDSMTRLCPADIETSSTGTKVMGKIKALSKKYNTTIAIIHHSTKPNEEKPLSYAEMAGTRVLSQEADFIIGVNRLCDGTRYIKEIMYRYKEEAEDVIGFKINENLLTEKTEAFNEYQYIKRLSRHNDSRRNNTLQSNLLSFINTKEGLVKRKSINNKFNEQGNSSKDKEIERALNNLIKNGDIIKPKKGVYQVPTKNSLSNIQSVVSVVSAKGNS